MLCASCVQAPPKTPPIELPPRFEGTPAAGASWPSEQWYQGFSSAELTALVEAAVKNNLDLGVARSRVAQADARARQAGAAILPTVDALGNVNYLAGHSSSSGSGHETDWSALLSASYETVSYTHLTLPTILRV